MNIVDTKQGDPVHGAQAAQTNYQIFYNSQYDLTTKFSAAVSFAAFAAWIARNGDSKIMEMSVK